MTTHQHANDNLPVIGSLSLHVAQGFRDNNLQLPWYKITLDSGLVICSASNNVDIKAAPVKDYSEAQRGLVYEAQAINSALRIAFSCHADTGLQMSADPGKARIYLSSVVPHTVFDKGFDGP